MLGKDISPQERGSQAADAAATCRLDAHVKYCVSLLHQAKRRNNQELAYSFLVETDTSLSLGRAGNADSQASNIKRAVYEMTVGS